MVGPYDSSIATVASKATKAKTSSGALLRDIFHPFYLHPSDSPGMLLVNTPFDSKGCGVWHRGILIALSAKNKVGFIDGTFLKPKISCDSIKSWTRTNDMVISWLLNTLTKEIAESVLYSKTAREIWLELEERFGQSNGPQLYHLQKEINEPVQEDNGDQSFQSGDKPMTQDQYHSLYQLLQSVKVANQGDQINEDVISAHCAGPFTEEASGAW
nr:uncharacterized protein LOC117275862 [Nicotiana tomentosiformis]